MKLQQLRYLQEVARCGLNLSEAAESLHTSQPGISKQIRQLEDELGVDILIRHGKRVVDVTEPGRVILGIAERMLQDAENLARLVTREHGTMLFDCRFHDGRQAGERSLGKHGRVDGMADLIEVGAFFVHLRNARF